MSTLLRRFCSAQSNSIRNLETSRAYIRDNMKKNDPKNFLISFFQPKLIRDDFLTIYWLNKELARLVFGTRERPLGLGKLDFWIETVENLYQDKVNQEPISVCLASAIKTSKIPKSLLLRILQAYVRTAVVTAETRNRVPGVS